MARCCHFNPEDKSRCRLIGLFSLCKDGDKFSIGLLCEEHAELIVNEYTEKLGWDMLMVRVSEEEQITLTVSESTDREELEEVQQVRSSKSLMPIDIDALLEDLGNFLKDSSKFLLTT